MPLSTKAALSKDLAQSRGREVFQHRHYAEIARIIRTVPNAAHQYFMATTFCRELSAHNRNFDHKRFLAACGVA